MLSVRFIIILFLILYTMKDWLLQQVPTEDTERRAFGDVFAENPRFMDYLCTDYNNVW